MTNADEVVARVDWLQLARELLYQIEGYKIAIKFDDASKRVAEILQSHYDKGYNNGWNDGLKCPEKEVSL